MQTRVLFSFITVPLCILIVVALSIRCEVLMNDECQYEDVVVRIDPSVGSGLNLRRVVDQINNLSYLMYEKTDQRISIKNFIILLPEQMNISYKWESNDWEARNLRRLNSADILPESTSILIAGSVQKLSQTLHLGGCGQPGEYIIVSRKLIDDISISQSERGMTLLHEWAHYRWGVFDEYATDSEKTAPFYINDARQISVTACPSELKGWLLTNSKNYSKCSLTEQGIPHNSCHFYIPQDTDVPSSIMMTFYNGSNEFFCSESGDVRHNSHAPNLHNLKCEGRSVWEIMKLHPDFSDYPPNKCKYKGPPNYIISRIEANAKSDIKILINREDIANATLPKVYQAIICLKKMGTILGLQVKYQNLTETSLDGIPLRKDKKTFVISDTWSHKPVESVKYLLNKTDFPPSLAKDKKKFVRELQLDLPISEFITALFKQIFQSSFSEEERPRLIHKKIFQANEASGNIHIDTFCEEALFFGLSKDGVFIERVLQDPHRRNCLNDSLICKKLDSGDKFTELISIRTEDISTKGTWIYNFVATQSCSQVTALVFCVLNKKGIPTIHSRIFEEKEKMLAPKLLMVTSLSEYEHPVIMATVHAIITQQNGSQNFIPLLDDGYGADVTKNDGIYSTEWLDFGGTGLFSICFEVETNKDSNLLIHHKQEPKFWWNNGYHKSPLVHSSLLSQSEVERIEQDFGPPTNEFLLPYFIHGSKEEVEEVIIEKRPVATITHITDSSYMTVQHYTAKDIYPPGRVTDLTVVKISSRHSTVTLEWTSVGNNGFHGTANSILLKYSQHRSFYPHNFHTKGIPVIEEDLREKSNLQPKMSRTTHRIIVEMPKENNSHYLEDAVFFFAMVVCDEAGNEGKVSNLAYAFFKPREFNEEIQDILEKASSSRKALITFCVFVFIIALFIIIVTLYRNSQKRKIYDAQKLEAEANL